MMIIKVSLKGHFKTVEAKEFREQIVMKNKDLLKVQERLLSLTRVFTAIYQKTAMEMLR